MRMLKNPIPKQFADHQKAFISEPTFEHVIEYERSKTGAKTVSRAWASYAGGSGLGAGGWGWFNFRL